MISARGLDSVPSFGYAYGMSGKVCAHIYIGFLFIKIIISQIIDYSNSDNQKSAFTGFS